MSNGLQNQWLSDFIPVPDVFGMQKPNEAKAPLSDVSTGTGAPRSHLAPSTSVESLPDSKLQLSLLPPQCGRGLLWKVLFVCISEVVSLGWEHEQGTHVAIYEERKEWCQSSHPLSIRNLLWREQGLPAWHLSRWLCCEEKGASSFERNPRLLGSPEHGWALVCLQWSFGSISMGALAEIVL